MFIKSGWHALDIDDFSDYCDLIDALPQNTLVTFQSADLIRYLKSSDGRRRLPAIIDLECFDKQMSQEGKEFRKYKAWKALSFLNYHKIVDSDFEFKQETFKLLLEHLATLYLQLLNKDEEEKIRFETVETKINKIIYKRQSLGVRIDLELAKKRCGELEEEIYHIKNVLQQDFRVFSPDNEEEQLHYLASKGYNLIKSPLFTFKARRKDDEVCRLFYEMLRNQRDLDSFLYMLTHWGGAQRTYPTYLGFGSITSRIILREPSLQNMRKRNRTVIVPDERTKLLYIDYSQFEAGILASLSKDPLLLKLYEVDIYKHLAKNVLGDEENRSDAKIIFYRYMYGDTSLDTKAKNYFQRFRQLAAFKKSIDDEIRVSKKIGTSCGNYRFRNDDDEHTWSLSHRIQATASLIYKNAVIRVADELPSAKFLVPMHDGTLYQIETSRYLYTKIRIEEIYKEEFKKMCPEIEPLITCSESFE